MWAHCGPRVHIFCKCLEWAHMLFRAEKMNFWMGPVLAPQHTTDGLAWAQRCLPQHATDGLVWAQYWPQSVLPIVLYGPIAGPQSVLLMVLHGPKASTMEC